MANRKSFITVIAIILVLFSNTAISQDKASEEDLALILKSTYGWNKITTNAISGAFYHRYKHCFPKYVSTHDDAENLASCVINALHPTSDYQTLLQDFSLYYHVSCPIELMWKDISDINISERRLRAITDTCYSSRTQATEYFIEKLLKNPTYTLKLDSEEQLTWKKYYNASCKHSSVTGYNENINACKLNVARQRLSVLFSYIRPDEFSGLPLDDKNSLGLFDPVNWSHYGAGKSE